MKRPSMDFEIREVDEGFPQVTHQVTVSVEKDGLGVLIKVKGYGHHCCEDGEGHIAILEQFRGKLRLVVNADIQQEDPTHFICLEQARECDRLAAGCEDLTVRQVNEYIQNDGNKCPYCNNSGLHMGEWDTQSTIVFRPIKCSFCGRSWTDEYHLAGITEH
jgi:hypothetical protein